MTLLLNVLAAFQGLGFTYTQQTFVELLDVQVPWPQQGEVKTHKRGRKMR
jgi:hypothetical protein